MSRDMGHILGENKMLIIKCTLIKPISAQQKTLTITFKKFLRLKTCIVNNKFNRRYKFCVKSNNNKLVSYAGTQSLKPNALWLRAK